MEAVGNQQIANILKEWSRGHYIKDEMILGLSKLAEISFKDGLRKAQELYRSIHSGGCHALSLGDGCNCFLCLCDREINKLNTLQ